MDVGRIAEMDGWRIARLVLTVVCVMLGVALGHATVQATRAARNAIHDCEVSRATCDQARAACANRSRRNWNSWARPEGTGL